jgi:DNA-binding transcriptional MocR family regulator
MGHQNAVVVSQKVLAKMLGCTDRTIRNALSDLVAEGWIEVVQIGAAGSVNAYVVNARVAWGQRRDQLHLAVFTAQIIADADDQPAGTTDRAALRRIPTLYPGEQQLPAGDGEPPPSEPALPGFEADLPVIGSE